MQQVVTINELNEHISEMCSFQKQFFDQTGDKGYEQGYQFYLTEAPHAAEWIEGIKRLLKLTKDLDTSGGRTAAEFLCNIYNGNRVQFNLSDLNNLSMLNWIDAMNILKLNKIGFEEIHHYIENGTSIFEDLIKKLNEHQSES